MTQGSDHRAQFSDLILTYAGSIRRLCAAYCAGSADREDLSQEILFAVWRALPKFRGESSVRTWIYRIAHNTALTWQARDRRRLSREVVLDDDVQPAAETELRGLALARVVSAVMGLHNGKKLDEQRRRLERMLGELES